MSEDFSLKIKESIEESISLKKTVLDEELFTVLVEAGESIIGSILKGGKVLICGNGICSRCTTFNS